MHRLLLGLLCSAASLSLAPRAGAAPADASGNGASAPNGQNGQNGKSGEAAPAAPGAVDLAKLRADYDKLRDQLYRSRARAELVEEGLYASKLSANLRWKGAPDFILHRAEMRLDGNSIWDSGEKPLVDERISVAERPIKPGLHSFTVRLEVRPGKKAEKEKQDLGYATEHTFVINVPDNRRTNVAITADDDGDLPEYEPEMDMELEFEK